MSDQLCPEHGTQLRPGKFGMFCPTKNPDGSWCKYKPGKGSAPKPAATVAPPSSATPQYLLTIAALDFAGKVYQGTGDYQSALEAAERALSTFKGDM